MKKIAIIIAAVALTVLSAASSCQNGKMETMEREVHDTVFVGDTVVVHDTIVVKEEKYYDGKWLKQKFESCEWKEYESYEYGFVVSYPELMEKDLNKTSESSLFAAYKDIRLMAKAYRDEMSVEQKYQEVSKSANTKSMDENYFMIAGRMGDNGCYFEKDIRMDGYWLYIRAEFPQEFTPYIDILLQYVKNYGPTIVDREK